MKRSMRLPPKKENMEDIPVEEDVPKDFRVDETFPIDHSNSVKPNEVTKDVFNTIKEKKGGIREGKGGYS